MRVENGILYFDDGSTFGGFTSIQEAELVKVIGNKNDFKIRVKQALKLKEAGFNGKEIIEVIGELE